MYESYIHPLKLQPCCSKDLIVSNLPAGVNTDAISGYFSRYGPVRFVTFVPPGQQNMGQPSAHVQFALPDMSCTAAKSAAPHVLNGTVMNVALMAVGAGQPQGHGERICVDLVYLMLVCSGYPSLELQRAISNYI